MQFRSLCIYTSHFGDTSGCTECCIEVSHRERVREKRAWTHHTIKKSAVLSSIFLKERLSFQGKVGCLQCVLGAIIIVMHAPEQGAADTSIETFKHLMLSVGKRHTPIDLASCLTDFHRLLDLRLYRSRSIPLPGVLLWT